MVYFERYPKTERQICVYLLREGEQTAWLSLPVWQVNRRRNCITHAVTPKNSLWIYWLRVNRMCLVITETVVRLIRSFLAHSCRRWINTRNLNFVHFAASETHSELVVHFCRQYIDCSVVTYALKKTALKAVKLYQKNKKKMARLEVINEWRLHSTNEVKYDAA